MCEKKLEPEKGEAGSKETAQASVLWVCDLWVTELQDNSNTTFHDCKERDK